MRLQRQSNQQIITWTSPRLWGMEVRRVFAVPQDETLVAKVYHKPTVAHAQKLVAMLANPPENPTAGQGHFYCLWLTCWEGWLVAMPQGLRKMLTWLAS